MEALKILENLKKLENNNSKKTRKISVEIILYKLFLARNEPMLGLYLKVGFVTDVACSDVACSMCSVQNNYPKNGHQIGTVYNLQP